MARTLTDRAPWILAASLAIVCVVVIAYAGFTSTAAFGPYTTTWEGTSELRGMADDGDRTVTIARNTTAYADVTPNETVAFVLSPDEGYDDRDADRIARFLDAGGTLIVADSRAAPTNALLARVNATARIDGDPLRDETDHGPSPRFPVTRTAGNHTTTTGLETVMLNHGSAVAPGDASVLLESSPYGYLDHNRNDELDDNETLARYPVAAAEPIGGGEVVVIGDASALMNVMLERADNRQLAATLLAGHETVLFDVSHDASLPPLALATLLLRESAALQLLAIVSAFGGIWWLARREFALPDRGHERADPADAARYEPSSEQIRTYLERRHPDWEPERLDRVVRAIVDEPAVETERADAP